MTAPREEELESKAENGTDDMAGKDTGEGSGEVAGTAGDEVDATSDPEAEPSEVPEPEEICLEDALRAERDAFEGKWLRVVAELDNYRKRARKEVVESRRFAQADLLRSLLEVQDNFERALQAAGDESDTETTDSFREGVELIFQKFRGLLKDKGVEPMEALGAEFDPNFHEAVGQLPREGVEPGQVIEVVQQGFHFGDMVLRPARVIISS